MSRSISLYLKDIVTGCEKILRYTEGMTFDEFLADERTYDAGRYHLGSSAAQSDGIARTNPKDFKG